MAKGKENLLGRVKTHGFNHWNAYVRRLMNIWFMWLVSGTVYAQGCGFRPNLEGALEPESVPNLFLFIVLNKLLQAWTVSCKSMRSSKIPTTGPDINERENHFCMWVSSSGINSALFRPDCHCNLVIRACKVVRCQIASEVASTVYYKSSHLIWFLCRCKWADLHLSFQGSSSRTPRNY